MDDKKTRPSRHIAIVFCALVLILPVMLLAGCGTGLDSLLGHVHSVEYNKWEKDGTGHWHVCETCTKRLHFSEHDYSEERTACSVCGYPKPTESEQPLEPEKPKDPDQPDGPEEPEGPGEPDEPDEPEQPSDELTDSYIAAHSAGRYGYDWLSAKPRGALLTEFYDTLDGYAKAFESGGTTTDVPYNGHTYKSAGRAESTELTSEEIANVYDVYCYDHPYNFWQDQSTLLSGFVGNKNYVYVIVANDYTSQSELSAARAEINGNIRRLYASAAGAKNDYDILAAYYREIATCCSYTYDSSSHPSSEHWAHSIVGILDDDPLTGPVCEGYARVLQLMLGLSGVNNVYCVGHATNDGAGGGGGHAWNMVELDGGWYYCDLTWDDADSTGDTLRFDYCAISSGATVRGKLFTETHIAGSPSEAGGYFLYDLPEVSATAYAADFALGAVKSDAEFEFVRNGMTTVGIKKIKTNAASVNVPETVTLDGKTYTVIELGPNYNGDTVGAIVTSNTRTVILPKTIIAVRMAAFNCNWQITIKYAGTAEEWGKVTLGNAAFYTAPVVQYNVT